MGVRGPVPEIVPDTGQLRIKPVLVQAYADEWEAFQRRYGKGHVSARIRELVREDLARGSNTSND